MGLHAVGEIVDIDHSRGDARARQPLQHVVHQGLAANLDKGLGPVLGQGSHSGAEAGGQDHGRVRNGRYLS